MNLKVYEKTRYQNIYRHKKNKNYLIMISKPVKSSISFVEGEKIYKLEDALKIRDNPKIKLQKKAEVFYKDGFDELYQKYLNVCRYELKLAFSTTRKKEKIYNKFFKNKLPRVQKITKDYIAKFIDDLDTSTKQKNEVIAQLKCFLSWCVKEELLVVNPMTYIHDYKIEKEEMKYWLPDDLKAFFNYVNSKTDEELYYRTKMFVLLMFTLSARCGEVRALTFNSVDKDKNEIFINHSINYDTKSKDYLSSTKTYSSIRSIKVTNDIIKDIEAYKYYLINYCDYDVKDDSLIFYNYRTNRPYSDVAIRKDFIKICKEAKVPLIRLYDLRHTSATILLNYGKVDMWAVSNRLGHKNINTTLKKYNHITNKVREEMAEITTKYI